MINVKDYGAVGDGVANDTVAIQAALASALGQEVFFPRGKYLATINYPGSINIVGPQDRSAVLVAPANLAGGQILVKSGKSSLKNFTLIGPLHTASEPISRTEPIVATGIDELLIENCDIAGYSWTGITLTRVSNVVIEGCNISDVASMAVYAAGIRHAVIRGNKFHDFGMTAISAYGEGLLVEGNICYRSGPVGGFCLLGNIGARDLVVRDNIIYNSGGIAFEVLNDPIVNAGYTITGNSITRAPVRGMDGSKSAVNIIGNTLVDCGYALTSTNNYTCRPQIVIKNGQGGSGYKAGDLLTVQGGTYNRPARVLVVQTYGSNGSLWLQPATNNSLYPIDMGDYSQFPPNPVTLTGGHGSGAQGLYSNVRVATPGSGYRVGDLLRLVGGTPTVAPEIMVTGINTGGAIATFELITDGSYTGTLPTVLGATNVYAGQPGTGATFRPVFSNFYTDNYGSSGTAASPINLRGMARSAMTGNLIQSSFTTQMPGILFIDMSGYPACANNLVASNIFRGYANPLKHFKAGTFDDLLGPGTRVVANLGVADRQL